MEESGEPSMLELPAVGARSHIKSNEIPQILSTELWIECCKRMRLVKCVISLFLSDPSSFGGCSGYTLILSASFIARKVMLTMGVVTCHGTDICNRRAISSRARLPHRHSWRFINRRCQARRLKQIWRISFAMINHQRHGNLAFLLHPTLGRRWLIGATASGWINFSCSGRKSGKVTRHALQHQSQLCADRGFFLTEITSTRKQ